MQFNSILTFPRMEEAKAKYLIQFGINSDLCSVLLEDMKNIPFTFCFDEIATLHINKLLLGSAVVM